MDYVWVGLGAVIGANARFALGRWLGNLLGPSFPYATLLVNITGAILIGFIATLLTEVIVADPRIRLFLVIGGLGGYTTFSSYAYEVFTLAERGDWGRAALYVTLSNVVGLVGCVGGVLAGRAIGAR